MKRAWLHDDELHGTLLLVHVEHDANVDRETVVRFDVLDHAGRTALRVDLPEGHARALHHVLGLAITQLVDPTL